MLIALAEAWPNSARPEPGRTPTGGAADVPEWDGTIWGGIAFMAWFIATAACQIANRLPLRPAVRHKGTGAGAIRLLTARPAQAPVAQLDRALPSEGRGHRFESCRVRQKIN